MILLDSLYINNSGGKILLDYLVKECEKNHLDVFYLFDNRCEDSFKEIPSNKKLYLKATLLNRLLFYTKNKNKFSSVLCFGNIPPLIKMNAKVFTYFHQLLFLGLPDGLKLKQRLKLKLKIKILTLLKQNTDYWIVQSELIKEKLNTKFNLFSSNTLCIPFFEPTSNKMQSVEPPLINSYIYVSNATPHKNHKRLIQAFCEFYDEHKTGVLTLTIPFNNIEINEILSNRREEGYPIKNLGFVERSEIIKAFYQHQYLIFPSLAESFGLGLVEAIECNCKVISADLPYVYEVCKPSLVFDPYNIISIKRALDTSLKKNLPNSEKRIWNKIDDLLILLND